MHPKFEPGRYLQGVMRMANRISAFILAAMTAFAADSKAADFKFMTFNIRYASNATDWNNRKAQVIGVIQDHSPDVVGLQEALRSQLNDMTAALTAYGELGVGRNDGKTAGEYSAIYYKKSLFAVDTTSTYWLSNTPETPGSIAPGAGSIRINTWARFRHLASGRHFYFNNSHWDNVSASARMLGARLIAERIANRAHRQDPVVFTCDCNEQISQEAVRYMLGQGGSPVALTSAYHKVYPADDPQSATYHNFTGNTAGRPIDHIFYSDSLSALSASIIRDHVGSQYPSDHFPVLSTIRVPTPVPIRRVQLFRPQGEPRDGGSFFLPDGKSLRLQKSGTPAGIPILSVRR
jgi:endonuclease/exonuclease/phosphatase family metal-dependent hydrolase